jgi:hypothetical protein
MQPPRTNGKAIAALVLGILSIVTIVSIWLSIILGILAIIFASLALRDIKRRYEGGRGLAIAGLVCGIIPTVIIGFLFLIGIAFGIALINS